MGPSEHKRCLGCGYILDHLPEPRCPECGRGFDPLDPETYFVRSISGLSYLVVAIVASALLVFSAGAVLALGMVASAGWPEWAVRVLVVVVAASASLGLTGEGVVLAFGVRALLRPRHMCVRRGALIVACVVAGLPLAGCAGAVVYALLAPAV